MKWIKQNDQEIETNDEKATIEHCESIGWKRADKPVVKKKKAKKEAE